MKHVIRDARMDDAPAIAAIHLASWQTAYRGLIDDDCLDNLTLEQYTWNWESWLAFPNSLASRTFVIEENGEILGFAGIGPNRDGEDPNAVAELYGIYLHPDHWRRGFGRELMVHILADLRERNFREFMLWVLDGNQLARRFYEKIGMVSDGEAKLEIYGDNQMREVQYRMGLAE